MFGQVTVQFRDMSEIRDFYVLADAIAYGLSRRKPFDISVQSGAIIWAWEQRP